MFAKELKVPILGKQIMFDRPKDFKKKGENQLMEAKFPFASSQRCSLGPIFGFGIVYIKRNLKCSRCQHMKDIENMHTKGLPPGSIGRLKEVKIRFFLMHNAVHNAICHLYPQCYFHLLLITVGLCFFKTSTNGRILARVTHLYVCLWMKAIPQY